MLKLQYIGMLSVIALGMMGTPRANAQWYDGGWSDWGQSCEAKRPIPYSVAGGLSEKPVAVTRAPQYDAPILFFANLVDDAGQPRSPIGTEEYSESLAVRARCFKEQDNPDSDSVEVTSDAQSGMGVGGECPVDYKFTNKDYVSCRIVQYIAPTP